MKGLNFKSNLKPTPNSFMSADQWGEEVRIQQKREKRTDYRLRVDENHLTNTFLLWGETDDDSSS